MIMSQKQTVLYGCASCKCRGILIVVQLDEDGEFFWLLLKFAGVKILTNKLSFRQCFPGNQNAAMGY